jgi:hypothetical protein
MYSTDELFNRRKQSINNSCSVIKYLHARMGRIGQAETLMELLFDKDLVCVWIATANTIASDLAGQFV